MNLQAKYTELQKASVGALRVISQLEAERDALRARVERYREALERISLIEPSKLYDQIVAEAKAVLSEGWGTK